MVEKNRRRGGGRVTDPGQGGGTSRTTPAGTGSPSSRQHKPIVRFVALLAIVMLIATLATGIIALFTG